MKHATAKLYRVEVHASQSKEGSTQGKVITIIVNGTNWFLSEMRERR